eukprot:Pgem_evm1s5503
MYRPGIEPGSSIWQTLRIAPTPPVLLSTLVQNLYIKNSMLKLPRGAAKWRSGYLVNNLDPEVLGSNPPDQDEDRL